MRFVSGFALLLAVTPAFGQSADDTMAAHHHHMMSNTAPTDAPREGGQSAFAALQEIIARLEADPKTDWSKVDIEALRQHLIDMDNVTLRARVRSEPFDGGLNFVVTGEGETADSIRHMTLAHAATMNSAGGWAYSATARPDGAEMRVTVPPQDLVKLKALGCIGVLTRGMHHQMHHLMIARGINPHSP